MRESKSLRRRIILGENSNGSPCFLMIANEMTTLSALAITVAIAAPAAPFFRTATKNMSPAMLNTHAMATVTRGMWELPSPRKMLPSRLYAVMNTHPAAQILT